MLTCRYDGLFQRQIHGYATAMTEKTATPPSDQFSRWVAVLDTISGFTFAALAISGLITLLLPSPVPLIGISLDSFRSTWGAEITAGTVTFSILTVFKLVRFAGVHIRGAIDRRDRIRLVSLPAFSVWGEGKDAHGPLLVLQPVISIANKGKRDIRRVERVEIRLCQWLRWPKWYECTMYTLDGRIRNPLERAEFVSPGGSSQLKAHLPIRETLPTDNRCILVMLRLTDQLGWRHKAKIPLHHIGTVPGLEPRDKKPVSNRI